MSYLLFAGECYYATGGYNDFYGSFDYLIDAIKVANQLLAEGDVGVDTDESVYWESRRKNYNYFDWWQIVDSETNRIVMKSGVTPYGSGD